VSIHYPPSPITLHGKYVTLEPLQLKHEESLIEAASDGELWKLWFTDVPSPASTKEYIETALTEQAQGKSLPFAVMRNSDHKIIGSTRFLNIEPMIHRLEIGNTWYAKSAQRTPVNTECKFLLLQFAFESLACVAVEFRTNWFNDKSRAASLRLGAKQDGVLRNHRVLADGTLRDTVVFSILNTEWPGVKRNLLFRLEPPQ